MRRPFGLAAFGVLLDCLQLGLGPLRGLVRVVDDARQLRAQIGLRRLRHRHQARLGDVLDALRRVLDALDAVLHPLDLSEELLHERLVRELRISSLRAARVRVHVDIDGDLVGVHRAHRLERGQSVLHGRGRIRGVESKNSREARRVCAPISQRALLETVDAGSVARRRRAARCSRK